MSISRKYLSSMSLSSLKLIVATFLGILLYSLFFYLCWSAQTDAQGMIGFLLFIPVAGVIIGSAIFFTNHSKHPFIFFSKSLRLILWLPIALFYLCFIFSSIYKPMGAPGYFVLQTVSKLGENITGVSPYDWGRGNRRIHLAARRADLFILESELKRGVPIDLSNSVGETPLFFCVNANQIEMCRMVAGRGANLNHQRLDGSTVMHLSALNDDSIDMLRFLVTAGAKINIKNISGKTPLAWAEEKKQKKISAYLRSVGATK